MTEQTFLDVLVDVAGREPEYFPIGEVANNGPKINTAYWHDLPEKGLLTGFTIGLSAHARWRHRRVRPELMISVESSDRAWIMAMGYVAMQAANTFSFDVDETIDFRAQIASDSAMSAFLITSQMMLPESYDVIPGRYVDVALRQLTPLYAEELRGIRAHGPEKLRTTVDDPSNVRRKPVRF